MDKNAIKKYAVWARRELISRVSQRAYQYGIRENDIVDVNSNSIDGKVLTGSERKERQALIAQVKEKGFEQVMEEVAYTWFNRFSALRFMEVNGYLPTHVRVFTDDENNFKPQIITEAIHLELDGLDMDKVYEFKEADEKDELFKYLLITQCNALNKILPGMFQKIADYTELLLPDNLLREGSVIEQMIALIPEDDWKDAVQIIGWLYQYYNSEPKDTVFANLKKNIKITKENIPAATQLFTPDWIVRYMVENSLGRLWLEGHPNDELKSEWKYYLDEAEQEADVQVELNKIRDEYKTIKPEDIRIIDPCMGSGHILAYAFDVLIQIYEAYGYNTREAAKSIVENNIYGLDIDERAAQLAYFAVMMKARQYDRRFFSREVQPKVYAIRESNNLDPFCVDYFTYGDAKLNTAIQTLIDELYDAKEYGSILNVSSVNFDVLYARFDEIRDDISMQRETALNDLLPFVQVAEAMVHKYDVVVTNPPYMGSSSMNCKLVDFTKNVYPDTKGDLFACFIEKGNGMASQNGINCMVTMQSWMFLSSFEEMRKRILSSKTIATLMHMENMVMGIAFGTAVVAFRNYYLPAYKGTYNQIKLEDIQEDVPCEFPVAKNRFSQVGIKNYLDIPGMPVAYWANIVVVDSFCSQKPLGSFVEIVSGMTTGNNEKYMRDWKEVSFCRIALNRSTLNGIDLQKTYWFPYNKGGAFRRWYGNNDYVVNWSKSDEFNRAKTTMTYLYLKKCITWSDITSAIFSARACGHGFFFDVKGSCAFPDEKTYYPLIAFLNSRIAMMYIKILNPTVTTQVGDLRRIPFNSAAYNDQLAEWAKKCVEIGKSDWDSFETSWDFVAHPFVLHKDTMISNSFKVWKKDRKEAFDEMKDCEEKIEQFFIDLYQMKNEINSKIEDKYISVHVPDKSEDIRSFFSYVIGCIFGRYSLDVEGLVFAGGDWDASKYKTYPVDEDNIIPICDDEYFADDIVGRFVKFIETVYGTVTLEENLKFIADALCGKGSTREVIRNYFINDFYKDHCKTYQKRPIYWLFDSGKNNGFKALIYMHRYQPDTIARMRTDYVHEQQERYRTAIAHLEQRINDASTPERVKLNKQLGKLQDQAAEIKIYEEKIHHLADQMIRIDLDDGVKHNYEIFQDVLAKIK